MEPSESEASNDESESESTQVLYIETSDAVEPTVEATKDDGQTMLIILLISGMVATSILTITVVKVFKACRAKNGSTPTNKVLDASVPSNNFSHGGDNL